MIFAQTGSTVEAILVGADPGLIPGIEWEVYDPSDGSVEIARNGGGLSNPKPDTYVATFTAPATADSLLIRWTIAAGATVLAQEDLILSAGPPPGLIGSGVLPSLQDVGNLLRARTKTQGGTELGTFASSTRPTGVAVGDLILGAADEVFACTGNDFSSLPDLTRNVVERMVRRAIAWRACMDVEIGYFPEQVNSDRSAFERFRELYEGRDGKSGILAKICKAVEEAAGGEEPGVVDDGAAGGIAWSFVEDKGGLQGMGSVW